MIGKKPERPKGGFKIHEKQVQDLWDWLNSERILDGPGVQNTANGKKITWRQDEFSPMFKPYFNRENKYVIKMGIRTGYVYAPYDDGNSTYLPMLHQFPFEPKIGSNTLSSTPSPSLTLENSATNYIFLKLTWGYFEDDIGGEPFSGNHAFKADYGLEVFDSSEGQYWAVQDSSQGSGSYLKGIYTPIKKRTYYLNTAEFISQSSSTPPTETESITNMLCGWIKLDANGDLDTATNDGSRWFLEGPVYTAKPPSYISNISVQDSNHRTEPVAPVASSGETIPGA
jgi:hypothetical protein